LRQAPDHIFQVVDSDIGVEVFQVVDSNIGSEVFKVVDSDVGVEVSDVHPLSLRTPPPQRAPHQPQPSHLAFNGWGHVRFQVVDSNAAVRSSG